MSLWFSTVSLSLETLTTLGFAYTGKMDHIRKYVLPLPPKPEERTLRETIIPPPGGLAPRLAANLEIGLGLAQLRAVPLPSSDLGGRAVVRPLRGLTSPFPWELHLG